MNQDIKVVYITGCLGFIGSYVTRQCLEAGWQVRGVDKITYAANKDLLTEFYQFDNFVFEEKDINDIEFLYECDYVINIAAETHVGNSIASSNNFLSSNINGVHHLLELIKNYRQESVHKPTILHFSTDEVYGDIATGEHKETDPLIPSNPYSATKAAADMLILAWGRTHKIPFLIVRPTNNYGIGQYVEKLIPKSCKYLSIGQKIPLHNNGTPIRNWLHAEDTASAILTIINAGVKNEIYNICGGFELPNISVIKHIIDIVHSTNNYDQYLDLSIQRPGQDVRYALDDSKLRALGWKPNKAFHQELTSIVSYYINKFIW